MYQQSFSDEINKPNPKRNKWVPKQHVNHEILKEVPFNFILKQWMNALLYRLGKYLLMNWLLSSELLPSSLSLYFLSPFPPHHSMWLNENNTSNISKLPLVKPEHLYKRKKYILDPDFQSVSFKPNDIKLKGRGLHWSENKPVNAKHRKKSIGIWYSYISIFLWYSTMKTTLVGVLCISAFPHFDSFDFFPFELGSCNHWTAGKKSLIFTCQWKAVVGNCLLVMIFYYLFCAWQSDCLGNSSLNTFFMIHWSGIL